MEKKFIMEKKVGKALLSLGIGGCAACYLIELSRTELLPFAKKVETAIQTGMFQSVGIGMIETFIFLCSIFSLLTAPLFLQWNKKEGKKILILLFLLFIDVSGVVTVIARGEIFPLYMFILWISSVYVTWFCLELLGVLYAWVKRGTADGNLDIVKLTFIWTIAAFIIGKVW